MGRKRLQKHECHSHMSPLIVSNGGDRSRPFKQWNHDGVKFIHLSVFQHGKDISRKMKLLRLGRIRFIHLISLCLVEEIAPEMRDRMVWNLCIVLLCFSTAETSPERWSCSNVKQRAKRRWENLATSIFPKMLSSKFWNDDNSVGLVLCRQWRTAFFFPP